MNVIESDEAPPTYFRVNKVTSAFQDIVDTYGVPRYGEINPAAFTVRYQFKMAPNTYKRNARSPIWNADFPPTD